MYLSHLVQLNPFQNNVFEFFRYDAQLMAKTSKSSSTTATCSVQPPNQNANGKLPLETQQFGVSLSFIKQNHGGEIIAPVLRECVEYLSQPEGKFAIVVP